VQKSQHLVDAGIRTLKTAELLPSIRRVIAAAVWDAAAIGASETLFMVLGERIVCGESMTPDMQRVAAIVLGRCKLPSEEDFPRALSRRLIQGVNDKNSVDWQAALWAWSLTPQPRELQFPEEWRPHFPGWTTSKWVIKDIPLHPGKPFDSGPSSPRWQRLMHTAMAVLLCQKNTPTVGDVELVFFSPFLLAASAMGKWQTDVKWWDNTLSHRWADSFLVEQLTRRAAEVDVVALWRTLLEFMGQRTDYNIRLYIVRSRVWQWLTDALTPAQAVEGLEPSLLNALLMYPSVLPLDFRRYLLATLDLSQGYAVTELLGQCEPADSAMLERWLDSGADHTAARLLWALDAEKAFSILRLNAELSGYAAFWLCEFAPTAWVAEVAQLLITNPEMIGVGSCQVWARERLTTLRGHAPLLLQMLQAR
jgi:hypothetical protein